MSFLITWMNLEVIMLSKISQIERQKSHGITYVKSLKIESWKEAKNRKVVTRVCMWVSAHLCPTLCDIIDSSLPGSSVHGIFEARILEWVAIPFSRGSFWPRGQTQVSCIAGRFFTVWATKEVQFSSMLWQCYKVTNENAIFIIPCHP